MFTLSHTHIKVKNHLKKWLLNIYDTLYLLNYFQNVLKFLEFIFYHKIHIQVK
jgi:hypothetical protein